MKEEKLEPKPNLRFFLKNLGLIIKLKRSNRKKIERFVNENRQLEQPIIPDFEGTGGPMEEGMIYIMFNSEGDSSPDKIDSVFRFFWVNAPNLKFSVLDSFLVSDSLPSGQWEKFYSKPIFKNQSPERYHHEVEEKEAEIYIDGIWKEGYTFKFSDKRLALSANVKYSPFTKKGVLVYYNDRMAISPSMAQRFYDMFAFEISGTFMANNKKYDIKNGRGIIEHGLGIFSNLHIYDWRWLNLQFPEGAIHLFYHSLDLEKEGIYEAGEGALVIDNEWYHFNPGDFKIEEVEYSEDDNLPSKVPTRWIVTGGFGETDSPLLNLEIIATSKLSWPGILGKENQMITNYVLEGEGEWKGKKIKGKGTMENQMHRVIS